MHGKLKGELKYFPSCKESQLFMLGNKNVNVYKKWTFKRGSKDAHDTSTIDSASNQRSV